MPGVEHIDGFTLNVKGLPNATNPYPNGQIQGRSSMPSARRRCVSRQARRAKSG